MKAPGAYFARGIVGADDVLAGKRESARDIRASGNTLTIRFVRRRRSSRRTGRRGIETWSGTLNVPGLEFDMTRPTLTGATNKTTRAAKNARTARVRFTVTAQDDRDGVVTVRCTPGSGSRFRIGRTKVTCEATDGSANTASARFTVTVRARK